MNTTRARNLRQNFTDAEAKLWYYLRARRMNGHKFVRQEPIGRYIVDFVCREHRLIVEVDGGQHATDKRDAVRDQWLADQGYRVLRFWNNEVFGNFEGVWVTIANALPEERPPHPTAEGGRPLPASGER